MVIKRRRHVLGEPCEIWLVGDDQEHLCAAGDAALGEAGRIERLLGCEHAASPVAQLNREAAVKAVAIDHELLAVLTDCVRWFGETNGGFDPGSASLPGAFPSTVTIDPKKRTVRFSDSRLQLDLTAYAFGYALDAAACVLEDLALENAVLRVGEKVFLARGNFAEETPWSIPLVNPFDERLSWTTWTAAENACAVVQRGDAACVVIAPTAVEAAVFAEALANVGRGEAERFVTSAGDRLWRSEIAWLARGSNVVWLRSGSVGGR